MTLLQHIAWSIVVAALVAEVVAWVMPGATVLGFLMALASGVSTRFVRMRRGGRS